MMTISLCMIVLNEEKHIKRCLDSIKGFVDEIIIVDTGSTDSTKMICREFTDKIFDFKWIDDFSLARNFAFSHSSMDYIMWLDADDVVEEKDLQILLKWKKDIDQKPNCVFLKYNLINNNGDIVISFNRERIIRRDKGYKWEEPVHEYINIKGDKGIYIDAAVTHKKIGEGAQNRNLLIYQKTIKNGAKLSTRGLYYYGRELYYNKLYLEAIVILNKFLQQKDSWVEDRIEACIIKYRCYEALEEYALGAECIYESFKYDLPRAEAVCCIGWIFMLNKEYEKAIFWYNLATTLDKSRNKGFVNHDCYNYIPYMQMAVCYYRMGDNKLFQQYNELALKYKPNSQTLINNKQFYKT